MLGSTETGVNPKVEFYNRFQREMEEHDRDFEKRYDDDLNIILIFVSVRPHAVYETRAIGPEADREVSFSLASSLP